ncbi:MAG: acyl carrier protein [Bacteroidetes bacterium]|nr:acyl carrier protein [Bacteroidota bacterium]
MERSEILQKTGLVIADFFQLKDFVCSESTSAADVEQWNSFSHLPLMSKIETAFSIKFSFLEITDFYSLGDIVDCIHKKITGF